MSAPHGKAPLIPCENPMDPREELPLHLPALVELGNQRVRNRQRPHALPGGVSQLRVAGALECQVFLLRSQPVGHEQRGDRGTALNALHWCARVQSLDVASHSTLHDFREAFIELRATDNDHRAANGGAPHRRVADAEVLLHRRRDGQDRKSVV